MPVSCAGKARERSDSRDRGAERVNADQQEQSHTERETQGQIGKKMNKENK